MTLLAQLIGDWGHALAAALYAVMALWLARRRDMMLERRLLVTAIAVTGFWALNVAIDGVVNNISGYAESLRNLAWLIFMFVMLRRGEGNSDDRPTGITAIYGVLALLLVAQSAVDLAGGRMMLDPDVEPRMIVAAQHASLLLRMMVAVGALVLVHNLYLVAAPEGRAQIRLPMAALAAMWTYDLNLYGFAYMGTGETSLLLAMRGIAMVMLAPVIALGVYRTDNWTLRLSRTMTFRSLSLVAIGAYLVAMALLASMLDLLAGENARLVQIGLVFAMSAGAVALLPSARFRGWAKVTIAKNFFQHRYDYRSEWMRFSDKVGRPHDGDAPLYDRIVKALADITESPSALLFLRGEDGALALQSCYQWTEVHVPAVALAADDAKRLEHADWLFDMDEARVGHGPFSLPGWMLDEPRAWVLVPLIHFGRLMGAALLARPRFERAPDWEDFDMLRVAGRQAASYMSEAKGQAALSEAQRFEEFNRRFAFIMHDIKNLVSQISLLARNAQRHADNPAFRADMILTLEETAGRMNEMLARLSQHNNGRTEPVRALSLRDLIDRIARSRQGQHPVQVSGEAAAYALGDPVRIEQILAHLIQNAIEASATDQPITIGIGQRTDHVIVEIIDRGCGMSAEFMRNDLFQPFRSGKLGGFGIGAFEARTLAQSMGASLEVESREGEGSRFTLVLPIARTIAVEHNVEMGKAA